METYEIYRAIRVESINDVDFENIGISWTKEYSCARDHGEIKGDNYIILISKVKAENINIEQTYAQWESEHAYECEVVLKPSQNIVVEIDDVKYEANTGLEDAEQDETRPEAEECDEAKVLSCI